MLTPCYQLIWKTPRQSFSINVLGSGGECQLAAICAAQWEPATRGSGSDAMMVGLLTA